MLGPGRRAGQVNGQQRPKHPAPAQTIQRLPKEPSATSFDALRKVGVSHLQDLSSAHWSDYNLHDPGVTLLEALCFALTEQAYRAEADVASHLSNAQGRIQWLDHALPLPQDAFPARPSTLLDYRRWLLDQVPGLDGVQVLAGSGPQGLGGLYEVLIDAERGLDAQALEAAVQAAFHPARNLGEDLARVASVHKVPCHLQGEISIGGARDPIDIVAEIFERCASHVASAMTYASPGAAFSAGVPIDEVLDGPDQHLGQARSKVLTQSQEQILFITDLIACLHSTPNGAPDSGPLNPPVEGLLQVHWLALQPLDRVDREAQPDPATGDDGLSASASSLRWRNSDGSRALSLQMPPSEGELKGLTVRRRETVLHISALAVQRRCTELRAERHAQRAGLQSLAQACPPPRGKVALNTPQQASWLSVQHLLPAVYGVGPHGVPDSASVKERARARQLQGYLVLFDQMLADADAQSRHLRELWLVNQPATQSYWHAPLQADDVPGLNELLPRLTQHATQHATQQATRDAGHQGGDERRAAAFDNVLERKSRLLDVLLALHGQTLAQNSLRQSWSHLGPRELQARLFENKRQFLLAVNLLDKHRAAGLDITKTSWNQPDNSPGLQKLLGHLLGFAQSHNRSLTDALRLTRLTADAAPSSSLQSADLDPSSVRLDTHFEASAHSPAASAQRSASTQRVLAALASLPLAQRAPLQRCAARYDTYWLTPASTLPGAKHETRDLVLGPDDNGKYWPLARFTKAALPAKALDNAHNQEQLAIDRDRRAQACAISVRQALLALDDLAEGVFVVEHLLLRPPADTALTARQQDFFNLRVSVVFPKWTTRGANANFQALAEESARINCPAHLRLTFHWLQAGEMLTFEGHYKKWLTARCALADAQQTGAPQEAADSARALVHWLQQTPRRD